MTIALPVEATLVSASGNGWTCDAATCTRSDVLAPGASYPVITVPVSIASGATSVTTTGTVAGGNDGNPDNNTASLTTSEDGTVVPTDPSEPGDGEQPRDSDDDGCAAIDPSFFAAIAACFVTMRTLRRR